MFKYSINALNTQDIILFIGNVNNIYFNYTLEPKKNIGKIKYS